PTPGTTLIRFVFPADYNDVPIETVDGSGAAVPAKLAFNTHGVGATPGQYYDAPFTIRVIEGGRVGFAAEFGGFRPYLGITVTRGHTYTVDPITAESVESATPGTTAIRFVYPDDYNDVPFSIADQYGNPLDGDLVFSSKGLGVPTGQRLPAPQTVHILEGGMAVLAAEYGGLRPYAGVTVARDHTYTVDGETSDITGVESPGVTAVRFVFTVPNASPTANDDSAATDEDAAAQIDVLANDTDPDENELTVSTFTQPAGGQLALGEDERTFTYTPNAEFNGGGLLHLHGVRRP
ncbi:MAG: Ig-like domain-containing protein, partial [Elusimicrobiota bacterium]